MPNWCFTTYRLIGRKSEIDSLYGIMNRLCNRKSPTIENGFGPNWLGELVNELGADWNKVRCRGSFTPPEMNCGSIVVNTETAWEPCNEVFELIRKTFPSVRYYFYSEEEGCELYWTNDSGGLFFSDRWIVRTDEGEAGFRKMEDALSWISDRYGKPVEDPEDVEHLCNDIQEENEDRYVYLNEIKLCK